MFSADNHPRPGTINQMGPRVHYALPCGSTEDDERVNVFSRERLPPSGQRGHCMPHSLEILQ